MRSTLIAALGWGLCLATAGRAESGSPNGLYFRMMMSFGNITQDHWWFLPDGRYLNSTPANGLEPSVFEANCQRVPTACGTYKVQGSQIQLAPRKGQPSTMTYKPLDKGNIELDGRFTKHVDAFPAGAKLDGHYSWSGGASGGGTSVSAAKGFQFNPDGTFATSSVAGVSMGQQYGASSKGAGAGTYTLNGNVLELTSGGQTTRHAAYPYELSKGDVRINIDGNMYKRDR